MLAALSGRVIAKEQLPELSEARQWYDSSRSFSRVMLFATVLYLLLARYNHESEGVRVPYARSFSTMHRPPTHSPLPPLVFVMWVLSLLKLGSQTPPWIFLFYFLFFSLVPFLLFIFYAHPSLVLIVYYFLDFLVSIWSAHPSFLFFFL